MTLLSESGQAGTEIEITEEMMREGSRIISERFECLDANEILARDIFEAMLKAQ